MTQPTTAIARPTDPIQTLRTLVTSKQTSERLKDVASKYLQPEELTRCLLLAASRTPQIAECSAESIVRCMMDAAAVGIRPGGTNGRGWLIPRMNRKRSPPVYELTFDPGWRGLIDIARRSKIVERIEAHPVHAGDRFRVIQGTEPKLIHEPYDGDDDAGDVRYAYAVAFFSSGRSQFEVVSRRDLDKIREVSASKSGPWGDWYDEMARKSAVRRLCKYLPTDEELDYAIELSNRADDADGIRPAEGPPPAPLPPEQDGRRIRMRQQARAPGSSGGDAPEPDALQGPGGGPNANPQAKAERDPPSNRSEAALAKTEEEALLQDILDAKTTEAKAIARAHLERFAEIAGPEVTGRIWRFWGLVHGPDAQTD